MRLITFVFALLTTFLLQAQDLTLPLWPNGAPNENTPPAEERLYEKNGRTRYDNISKAELFVFQPEANINTGAAVVICPGGGYWIEAFEKEGVNIAKYLQQNGITGVVLKYRLPYGNPEVPLSDALQAIRTVRSKAAEWDLDSNKIGIAGSSAGGHLASMAGTQFDLHYAPEDPLEKVCPRPDFLILMYPVISMEEKVGHMGSRINLIGKTNDWNKAKQYSSELRVTDDTPPTFLILASDDHAVIPDNSIGFYRALLEHGVSAEMHIFSKGGHGFGMEQRGIPADHWPPLLINWLEGMGIISPQAND